MISVIIPTFNEEENISSLLDHLLKCESSDRIEIIVCDSPDSVDKGFEIAQKRGIKTLKSKKGGRALQMNSGSKHASYEFLYFLHADARPPIDFVNEIILFLSSDYDFGSFCYKFNSEKLILKINSFFTRFDGFYAGGGDQSLFIRKDVFEKLNGFNENLKIMEDFDFYKRAKRAKYKPGIIRKPLLVSARKYERNSWIKVSYINFRIFLLYFFRGPQEKMIKLNNRLQKNYDDH